MATKEDWKKAWKDQLNYLGGMMCKQNLFERKKKLIEDFENLIDEIAETKNFGED